MHKKFILWSMLFSIGLFGQMKEIDSLKNELKTVKSDTTYINLINKIAFNYYTIDLSLTKKYCDSIIPLALKINYKKGEAYAYNNLGIYYSEINETIKSIHYLEKALAIAQETGNKGFAIICLNNIGLSNDMLGNSHLAIENYSKTIKLATELNDSTALAYANLNIGYLKNIQAKRHSAIEHLKEAEVLGIKIKNHKILGLVYGNMAEYYTPDNLPKAKYYNSKCKIIGENTKNKKLLTIYHYNESIILTEEKKYNQALTEAQIALTISEEMGATIDVCNSQQSLALIYNKLGEYEKSTAILKKLIQNSFPANRWVATINPNKIIAENYIQLNDYKKAYTYLEKVLHTSDSLHLKNIDMQYISMEKKYEADKKNAENQILLLQKSEDTATIKFQKSLFTALLLIFILTGIVGALLYNSNRKNNRQNALLENRVTMRTKELEERNLIIQRSNKELEKFAYIASHDLKTPLNNITNFSGLLKKELNGHASIKSETYLNYILNSGERMTNLIEAVLEFSKLNQIKNEPEIVDLNDVVSEILAITPTLPDTKNAIIINSELPQIKFEKIKIYLVFKNIIENGLKYNTSENPSVTIYHSVAKNHINIKFIDNGIGIEERYYDKIFEMFGRLHRYSQYEGTGMGLALCKKIIISAGGTIELERTVKKGSSFIIQLPKSLLINKSQSIKPSALEVF